MYTSMLINEREYMECRNHNPLVPSSNLGFATNTNKGLA